MKPDIVIFDLDGVILDSANIVRIAYERAGASPPENILEQEGTNWLEHQHGAELAAKIRARKNEIYHELISHGDASLLSGFYAAQQLNMRGYYVALCTGAPSGTIDVFKDWLTKFSWPWPFRSAWDDMKTPAKMIFMRKLALNGKRGVYIDDQDRLVDTPVNWKFIHYQKQSIEKIYKEITS